MKVTREADSPIEVTLTIEMDSQDEESFIDRSYRRSVGRLAIPGFRKGKAPRSIVENYVGRTALLQEALEFMIPETLDQVLRDEGLQAFVEPEVELNEIEPVSFKAVVPLEPVVDLGDYQSLRVESSPVEVTEEQIDDIVERLRQEVALWEPVERPVQNGDLLNLNVQGTIDGEEVVNDEGIDYVPEEANVLPFPGFSPNLEGLSEGESKDFTIAIPEEYPRPQFAGKDCEFHVEVLSVKEKRLPEPDDEFAKGVGDGFDTFDALLEHIRERVTAESEVEAVRELEMKSLEELVSMARVEASDTLYRRELDNMQRERERYLQNQRVDMNTYLQIVGKTQEEFLEEMRPSANERLTRYLVMRKLSQAEEIEVSDEEVQEEIDSAVESAGESAEAMRRALASEAALDNVRSSILNRKIMQRLVEIVQPETGDDQDDQPAPTDDDATASGVSAEDAAAESQDAPSGEAETQEQPIADHPEASTESSTEASTEEDRQ